MPAPIDETRFPTLASFVARLPNGLASYPQCKIRGSLVHSMLQTRTIERPEQGLPEELVELIRHPPVYSAWVPQVHGRAILRVVYDEHFAAPERYATWAYESQKKLFSGPLYRILFWGISPERLMRMAVTRYEHFHVGVSMTLQAGPKGGAAMLRYPPDLFDSLDHLATLEGFRAALELAGAAKVRTEVAENDASSARLIVEWT